MKGIVRGLDDLGRITLPMEYRRTANINSGDKVGLESDGKIIRIKTDTQQYIGMVRPVDLLGRVVIPKEFRNTLKLAACDLVDMWVDGNQICIRKAALQCVICGSEDEKQLMEVDGVLLCRSCGMKVVDKFMED